MVQLCLRRVITLGKDIESLFYSNLVTMDIEFDGVEVFGIAEVYSKAEADLKKALGDKKDLLKPYQEAMELYRDLKCRKAFEKGFRIGGRIVLEVVGKR